MRAGLPVGHAVFYCTERLKDGRCAAGRVSIFMRPLRRVPCAAVNGCSKRRAGAAGSGITLGEGFEMV
jgi:hypothetical protein